MSSPPLLREDAEQLVVYVAQLLNLSSRNSARFVNVTDDLFTLFNETATCKCTQKICPHQTKLQAKIRDACNLAENDNAIIQRTCTDISSFLVSINLMQPKGFTKATSRGGNYVGDSIEGSFGGNANEHRFL